MVIVAGVAYADAGEGSEGGCDLIVGVKTGLKREKALGSGVRLVGKGLYMIVAHIATQTPTRRQLEVLAYAVEEGSRKLLVESHEMGSHS